MIPTPDERWAVAYDINSYDKYFEKVSERIYLKPEVDEHVKGIFKLVQRLIDLAYYEYEFLDLASMKALLAFELALKKRYREVKNPDTPNPRNLKDYIKWFRQNGYFETDSVDFLDQIRHIRNHFAHPEFHAFGGPVVSWHITAAAGLINDIYEDVDLRKARKQEIADLNIFLNEMLKTGALLENKAGIKYLVHLFSVGFINNKTSDKAYHFIYKPIFKVPVQYVKGDSIPVYPAFELTSHSVQLGDGELIGLDKNGLPLFRLSASCDGYENQLQKWHSEYKAYVEIFPHFPMIDQQNFSDILSRLFSDFYKHN